jgi:hypothetical protein
MRIDRLVCSNRAMARLHLHALPAVFLICLMTACSGGSQRGIADKRSDFKKFLPMEKPAAEYGLRQVRPFFKRADRAQILRTIEEACLTGGSNKSGSSAYNPATQAGYYVNCNPGNRQLLNGYIPLNARRHPHS